MKIVAWIFLQIYVSHPSKYLAISFLGTHDQNITLPEIGIRCRSNVAQKAQICEIPLMNTALSDSVNGSSSGDEEITNQPI